MHTFTDNQGREWPVVINVTVLRRVRSQCGVHLLECLIAKNDLVDRLATDPVFLADILYCACQEHAQSAGVSDKDFGAALAGDVIEDATQAFLKELVDFFPKGKRQVLGQALAARDKMEKRIQAVAAEKVLAITDDEIEKAAQSLFSSAGT